MTTKRTKKPIALTAGTFLAASIAAASPLYAGETSPALDLNAVSLNSGYMQLAGAKDGEGKCGEGKCGDDGKADEGKCGGDGKGDEGKCGGDGKDGEGK